MNLDLNPERDIGLTIIALDGHVRTYAELCAVMCPDGCGKNVRLVSVGGSVPFWHMYIGPGPDDGFINSSGSYLTVLCTAPTREDYEDALRKKLQAALDEPVT